MSKTSTSIGWVLVDERDMTGEPLDHDAFDITDSSTAVPAATARRIREIATASGFTVDSIHVTSSGNVSSLREALTDSGFGDVVPVSLAAATRAWAMSAARANGHRHIAVCLLGRDSASLSLIDTAGTAIQSTTTTISGDGVSLVDWLNSAFGGTDVRPEVLCLIGSRGKLDTFAGRLGQALSIPVIATHDAQLALARGAAFSDASYVDDLPAARRFRLVAHARTIVVVAAVAAATLFTLSSADTPNPLASKALPQPASPSPTLAGDIPASPAPVASMVLPPPPAEPSAPPAQEAPTPDLWAAAGATDVAAPQSIPTAVPDRADAPPPVQHIPDAQPVTALGPAPAPTVEISPSMPPPPPPDPLADALSPLFGGLP